MFTFYVAIKSIYFFILFFLTNSTDPEITPQSSLLFKMTLWNIVENLLFVIKYNHN